MSRRNKSFGYSKKYASSWKSFERFNRSVMRAVTPSKRTQRAIVRELFTPSSNSGSNTTVNKKQHQRTPVTWKDIKPSIAQWIGCLIVGIVCFYPFYATGAFEHGAETCLLLVLFFFFAPFLVAFLFIMHYNKSNPDRQKRNVTISAQERVSIDEFPQNTTLIPKDNGDYEIAEINAPLYMSQFKDSMRIMQKTADPETFFSRFDFAMEKLESLAEYEKLGIAFTGSPASLLEQARDEDNVSDTVNVLIDNAYKKQIQKLSALKTVHGRESSNQRWYTSFEPYFDKMPARSKTYLDLKFEALKEV